MLKDSLNLRTADLGTLMQVVFSLSSNENLFSGTVPFSSCSWSSQLLGVNNQGQQETSTYLSNSVEKQTENSCVWESSLLWRLPDEEDLIKL